MKKFYLYTYNFWIISRITFITLGFLGFLRLVILDIHAVTFFDICILIYLILFFIIFYKEITKSVPSSILKYTVGTLTILIGFYFAYLKFIEPKASWGLAKYEYDYWKLIIYSFSIWTILIGAFDFFTFNKNFSELD